MGCASVMQVVPCGIGCHMPHAMWLFEFFNSSKGEPFTAPVESDVGAGRVWMLQVGHVYMRLVQHHVPPNQTLGVESNLGPPSDLKKILYMGSQAPIWSKENPVYGKRSKSLPSPIPVSNENFRDWEGALLDVVLENFQLFRKNTGKSKLYGKKLCHVLEKMAHASISTYKYKISFFGNWRKKKTTKREVL
jgi:hypothetical protein